jgi:aspartate/methionine/tyrosine aminotransferase
MRMDEFKVEQWMNDFENDAVYNLGDTCIDTLTLGELLELAGESSQDCLASLVDTRLTYGHIFGSPELIKGIASLYEDIKTDQILPTHGATGANHQVIFTLLEEGDEMISVLPTYQQHYSISKSMGAKVNFLYLEPSNNFLPNINQLKNMVNPKTKLIAITNPNNPTSSLIPPAMLREIAEIARGVDAYILSDEIYGGLSVDGSSMPSIVDFYEKGISVGGMSKTYSLAGLRIGWIVSKDQELINECKVRRDYDTISCGILDEKLAALALKNKDKILERNKKIIIKNRAVLDSWVNSEPRVSYVKPQAGNTALIYYDADVLSYDFCRKILKEEGVFITPGSCFELEHCFRVGYVYDSETLTEGLQRISKFLSKLPSRK